jgi:hypothetical protein
MRRKRRQSVDDSPLMFSVALIVAVLLVYAGWIWLDPLRPRAEAHDLVIEQEQHNIPPGPAPYEVPKDIAPTTLEPENEWKTEKPAGGVVIEK